MALRAMQKVCALLLRALLSRALLSRALLSRAPLVAWMHEDWDKRSGLCDCVRDRREWVLPQKVTAMGDGLNTHPAPLLTALGPFADAACIDSSRHFC